MADSVLYLIHRAPDQGPQWRETVDMALTGAVFGVATTVWLAPPVAAHLRRRNDGAEALRELQDLGIRCVTEPGTGAPEGVDAVPLTHLRREAGAIITP